MFKRSINWQPFYTPVSETGTGVPDLTAREAFKALNDDASTSPSDLDDNDEGDDDADKRSDKSKDKKEEIEIIEPDDDTEKDNEDEEESDDEEVDELKLIEEELEEPDEEKLELVTPVSRKAILKKYPKIFEDFPYLEKAYYREQQFTEIFPNPEDARVSVEKSETLDKFENDLQQGNLETILSVVKGETPKSFAKMIDNLMPTLQKVDNQAYTHLVGNTIKQTIVAMVQEGNRQNNDVLKNAAAILNQFVFASSEFEPPKKLAPTEETTQEDPEKEQFRRERQQFITERFNEAKNDLNTRVNNSLKATIEANIDPNNTMTDYVRRNATRDALETVERLISQDTRFKAIVDKLWEKSFKENLSRNSVDTIRSAYLSKAKTLLDSVIKKSRNEALKGMGKRVKEDDKDKPETRRKAKRDSDDDQSRSRTRSDKSTDRTGIPKSMSTLQFLMQED